jgi:hypothetical protein
VLTPACSWYRWWPDGPDSRAGGAEATGRFWLVGLYVTLLLFMQLIYPLLVVLAIVDSLIDFRGRRPSKGTITRTVKVKS